jgi:hypothetical protein
MKPIIEDLRDYEPEAAEMLGYKSITTPINPRTEMDIIDSITESMKGIDAIWIDYGSHVELGRKKNELAVTPEH